MDAPIHDIEIAQGATFVIGFVYRDPARNPINITGWTGHMQVREKIGGRVLADLTTANNGIAITGAEGKVEVTIPANVTKSMNGDRGTYDLFITSPDGFAVKLIQGEATIIRSVTRT